MGHAQVPFRTVDGESTTVDEGLEDVMVTLRDRGIRTQYSCEDSGSGYGYIIMPMLSGWRFRQMIRGSKFAKNLDLGERSIEFGVFRKKRTRRITISSRVVQTGFSLEHLISRRYGLRTVYRWPADCTDLLQVAVRATSED